MYDKEYNKNTTEMIDDIKILKNRQIDIDKAKVSITRDNIIIIDVLIIIIILSTVIIILVVIWYVLIYAPAKETETKK